MGRKISILILLITVFSTSVSAGDLFGIHYRRQSVAYNEVKYFTITIENEYTDEIENISLEIIEHENFEVEILDTNDFSLFPNNDYEIGIRVKATKFTLFEIEESITIRINNNISHAIIKDLYIDILPPSFIWPIFGLFIGIVLCLTLIIIFVKLRKGEKND